MEERQRGQMSNVDDNNGLGSRGERQSSFQMAAIRRQYADREELEVELARRRSADIIASARQNAREGLMQRTRQQIQGIRRRWDTTSSYQTPAASHQQVLQNTVFSNSSEPRVCHSRLSDLHRNLGRPDQPQGVWGQTWGHRPAQFPSNIPNIMDRRRQDENQLLNSSTYFRIQIDHAAASRNFRSTAELTLPPACSSWTSAGRTGTGAGRPQQRHQAEERVAYGHPDVTAHHCPGTSGTGPYTRLPIIGGFSGHRALRETASFVDNPYRPSDLYRYNPSLRSSYIGFSNGNGIYGRPGASRNETGLTKETYPLEIPTTDAATSYCSCAQDFLMDLSGPSTYRQHCLCKDTDVPEIATEADTGVRGLPEEDYRHELPASRPGQDGRPSQTEKETDWNLKVSEGSEEEKSGEDEETSRETGEDTSRETGEDTGRDTREDTSRETGEDTSRDTGEDTSRNTGEDTIGILASLSDMEQFIQKMEEGAEFERNLGPLVPGKDSPVQPEDLCTLWQVITECEGVARVVEDVGAFDSGDALFEWSLDRLDRLATACYRFVVCLISDLVRISDRSSWKPEEFRIYMDAALLVKRTCQRMMEATADEQVSLRQRPNAGALLQILLVYIRTLRLVLELYVLLNNSKPPELSEWSSSLCEALRTFVTEATGDLLEFHELLSQRLPARAEQGVRVDCSREGVETEQKRHGDDECQTWIWRGDDVNSGELYDSRLLAHHQRMLHRRSESDDSGEGGSSEFGSDGIQNQPSLNQYLQSTSFSDSIIHDPYLRGFVSPSGPEYRLTALYNESDRLQDRERTRSDAVPSSGSHPAGNSATTAAPAVNESNISPYVETDQPLEGSSCYQSDPFGLDGTSSELTAQELDIFHSMLSPSTFQMLSENAVHPSAAHDENIMLAMSVEMASRVFTDTSSGVLNGRMVYGEGPDQTETFDVLVNRSSPTLLDDLVQLYINAPTKLLHSRLNVVFEGEPGVDGGALSREFFCLIFRALIDRTVKDRSIFEGDRGHLLPAVDHVLSEAKVYWIVGILVAQAACNGCHGLPGLCPAVRQFLANGARVSALEDIAQLTTLEDVADLDLRNLLKKVMERAELDEEEKTNLESWLNRSGFSFVMSEAKTEEAIRRILRYYVFESRMSQLVSIAEGMEELGFRPIPPGFAVDVLFPSGEEITLEDLFRCLLINENPAWRSRDLQRAFLFFRKLCSELHEEKIERLHLSDLLHFFTGAPYLKSGTSITFSHPDSGVIYPQARTCNLELIIPTLHKTYDDFKAAFSQALLLGSYGFGFA